MFTKLYENTKEKILPFFKQIIILGVILFLGLFKLPYYVDVPGGIINVFDKIDVTNPNSGTLNMPYVSELKASIPVYLLARFNDKWDIIKKEEVVADNETEKDSILRNKIMLKEANNSAVIYSYKKAGKNIDVSYNGIYVTYIFSDIADTDLKVGDKIIAIDEKNITTKEDVYDIINNKNVGDIVNIKVLHDKEEFTRTAKIVNYENRHIIGFMFSEDVDYEIEEDINFKFANNESGPSGGLAMTLGIYSYLTNTDLTKNKKIVATGTIDTFGNVGSIGGVKYKLLGAVKNKADIFIVPNGENYEEALNVKEKYNCNIDIVGVDDFDETLEYLLNL